MKRLSRRDGVSLPYDRGCTVSPGVDDSVGAGPGSSCMPVCSPAEARELLIHLRRAYRALPACGRRAVCEHLQRADIDGC